MAETAASLLSSGVLQPGMTAEELVKLIGPPLRTSPSTSDEKGSEQYVYSDDKGWFIFVYVTDGKVTSINH